MESWTEIAIDGLNGDEPENIIYNLTPENIEALQTPNSTLILTKVELNTLIMTIAMRFNASVGADSSVSFGLYYYDNEEEEFEVDEDVENVGFFSFTLSYLTDERMFYATIPLGPIPFMLKRFSYPEMPLACSTISFSSSFMFSLKENNSDLIILMVACSIVLRPSKAIAFSNPFILVSRNFFMKN